MFDLFDNNRNMSYLGLFLYLRIHPLGLEFADDFIELFPLILDHGEEIDVEELVCVVLEEILVVLDLEIFFEVFGYSDDIVSFA
jgi:hypothetical protein